MEKSRFPEDRVQEAASILGRALPSAAKEADLPQIKTREKGKFIQDIRSS